MSGKPQQLTAGDAREGDASLADDGTIAFEHFTGALHVWRVAHASNPKEVIATKVTMDAAVDISPNISTNGDWLAFSRGFGNRRNIWIKDMRSGTESLFLSSDVDKLSPIVDNSGEIIAFEERDVDGPSVFTLTRGQPARKLCTGCSNPTGWFDGGRAVLYREGVPSQIKMADPKTREAKIVLEAVLLHWTTRPGLPRISICFSPFPGMPIRNRCSPFCFLSQLKQLGESGFQLQVNRNSATGRDGLATERRFFICRRATASRASGGNTSMSKPEGPRQNRLWSCTTTTRGFLPPALCRILSISRSRVTRSISTWENRIRASGPES